MSGQNALYQCMESRNKWPRRHAGLALYNKDNIDMKTANRSKSELTFQHLTQRERQVDAHAPAYCRDATTHGRQHAVHHAVGSLWQAMHTARNEPAA